jgi:bifunctional DNase/RNase
VRVVVSELRNDTYHAVIEVDQGGRSVAIDSRTSDALALAVRVGAPIFVEDAVMEEAGIVPERDLTATSEDDDPDLSAFRDFVDNLNLDDLPVH